MLRMVQAVFTFWSLQNYIGKNEINSGDLHCYNKGNYSNIKLII